MPEDSILVKLIELVAKNPGNIDLVLLKLNDFLPPVPTWMLEQRELAKARRAQEKHLLGVDEQTEESSLYDPF